MKKVPDSNSQVLARNVKTSDKNVSKKKEEGRKRTGRGKRESRSTGTDEFNSNVIGAGNGERG